MKELLSPFFRVACIVIFLHLIMACDSMQKMYEERNDSDLAKAKYLGSEEIPQVGAKCVLTTSWREGRLYYIFRASPLLNPKESLENKPQEFIDKVMASKRFISSLQLRYGYPTFTVKLKDQGGFEIVSIVMAQPTQIVDNDNTATGIDQRSSVECSRKKYRDISSWEVQWRY